MKIGAGDKVKLVRSLWWPGLVAEVSDVKRDAWGNVTGVFVDVGRDDGPVLLRPEDIEVQP